MYHCPFSTISSSERGQRTHYIIQLKLLKIEREHILEGRLRLTNTDQGVFLKSVFHSITSPPAKKIEKEITFLHSFATEEICSASLVVENVKLLSNLQLIERNNNGLNFLMAEIFLIHETR